MAAPALALRMRATTAPATASASSRFEGARAAAAPSVGRTARLGRPAARGPVAARAADADRLTGLDGRPLTLASGGSQRGEGGGGGDPMGMLLSQRIVFLGGQVDDLSADAVISQLLLLDSQDPTKDIKLFINSPGGSVTAGMGIYDAMQMCRADISTVCFGLAASMGAFLLGAGTKGKRMSMPNSRIMIHQPLGGASGQAVDIEIQAKEIMFHKANLNYLMSLHTGQTVEKVEEDTDRDRYMSPLEAKQYGLIDVVIGGDDAGLKIQGSPKDFMKTKSAYIAWGEDGGADDGSRGSRFTAPRIASTPADMEVSPK